MSLAHAIHEVSCKRGLCCEPQQACAACPPVAVSRCLPMFPMALATGRVDFRPRPGPTRVICLVSGENVAYTGDAAVWAAGHAERLEREGWLRAVPQEMSTGPRPGVTVM
jgi:hypothetical protein